MAELDKEHLMYKLISMEYQNFPSISIETEPFKHQTHKMVKPTQTIRRQKPTNCLSVFDHFAKLAVNGLKQARPAKNRIYQSKSNRLCFKRTTQYSNESL